MNQSKLVRFLSYLTAVILVLVPFQALITTWPGANFGHLDLFRIWKELLLVPLTVGCAYLIYRDKKLTKWFLNSPLTLLIAAYILLNLVMGLIALNTHKVNESALIYGLIVNLRFLVFFLACLVLAAKSDWLKQVWQKIILWPAAVVITFGLFQKFVLPVDFLSHFGYGPKTIPAFQAVDLKPQYIRLQSTLRGPNPLGAYLVVILSILMAWWLRSKQWLQLGLAIALTLVVLYFTYSRSAWLGTIVSCGLLAFWLIKNQKSRQYLLIGGLGLALILLVAVLIWHKNNAVENTFFHTSQTSTSPESSNQARTNALSEGAKDVLRHPLGLGPGTAGPASIRNTSLPSKIAENYFIQVGQEVGWLGLALFIAINIYVALKLWANRQDELARIALAALIGLTLVNLISHAWADDTLAYIYWGLAGLALANTTSRPAQRQRR